MAELADALDLGSSALWRESSSLSGRTLGGGSGGNFSFLRDSGVFNSGRLGSAFGQGRRGAVSMVPENRVGEAKLRDTCFLSAHLKLPDACSNLKLKLAIPCLQSASGAIGLGIDRAGGVPLAERKVDMC